MFVAGDLHAGQGDGEVSGNAIEASDALTAQFIVHKGEGKDMDFPLMPRTPRISYILGMDHDLGKALASSIKQTAESFWANNTACRQKMPIRSMQHHH